MVGKVGLGHICHEHANHKRGQFPALSQGLERAEWTDWTTGIGSVLGQPSNGIAPELEVLQIPHMANEMEERGFRPFHTAEHATLMANDRQLSRLPAGREGSEGERGEGKAFLEPVRVLQPDLLERAESCNRGAEVPNRTLRTKVGNFGVYSAKNRGVEGIEDLKAIGSVGHHMQRIKTRKVDRPIERYDARCRGEKQVPEMVY